MKIKNKVSAKLLGSIFLMSSVLFLTNCRKENDFLPTEESNSTENISLNDSLGKLAVSASEVSSTAYNISRALPSGYVKNGTRDYTSYVQAAINKYSTVVFPAFPILVNDKGITIPSNRKIYFLDGAQIWLKGTSKSSYQIFKMQKVSNVTIIDAVIKGDRAKHIGTTGEYGIGIGIYSSSNITLTNPKVTDCWGDGIYIGRYGSSSTTNTNIKITTAYLKNNRRDGISIISADGLTLDRPYAGYTNGTKPQSGINIEPNSSSCQLKNINIINPVTENNVGNGIQMWLYNMYNGSTKSVSINITNHKDNNSYYAYKVSNLKRTGYLSGNITSKNPSYSKSASLPLWMKQTDPKLKTYITSPSVTTTSGTLSNTSCIKKLNNGVKSDSQKP
ncbi:hypothetical protein, partial [Rubrolithibacter danxiaensis]|uniref:hypothetical protein n=1 Tax=Rubrolithibacter danxiaensis TaxID=3390805 RepID=UPI003BF843A3